MENWLETLCRRQKYLIPRLILAFVLLVVIRFKETSREEWSHILKISFFACLAAYLGKVTYLILAESIKIMDTIIKLEMPYAAIVIFVCYLVVFCFLVDRYVFKKSCFNGVRFFFYLISNKTNIPFVVMSNFLYSIIKIEIILIFINSVFVFKAFKDKILNF